VQGKVRNGNEWKTTHENIGASFLCRGEERDTEWRVFVQLARYETFDPMMRPLPEMPAVCKPIAVATDGNNDFRETHLVQRRKARLAGRPLLYGACYFFGLGWAFIQASRTRAAAFFWVSG